MLFTKGVVLSHIISLVGIEVYLAKIEVVKKFPVPKIQEEVRSFLGHVGYYRCFIEKFTKIATLQFKLLRKYVEFTWDDHCQFDFETLKLNFSDTPVLRGTNWSIPFHISADALHTTLGVVLGQKETHIYYGIYFMSKNITLAELNYIVTEKYLLAVIHVINNFRHYILGYDVFIHTDHSTICFLMNNSIANGIITRWLFLLQELNITIVNWLGKENQVVDFLSRLHTEVENIPVNDEFLDEYLFVMSTHTSWFVDIANYLATWKLLQHLSFKEKQIIIWLSANYSWMERDIYCTELDLIICQCVWEDEMFEILKESHDGPCRGQFYYKMTTYKVLRLRYYWPTLFKDAKKYVRSYDNFQTMGKPIQRDKMPLHPQVVIDPFDKWAWYFVGLITPMSRKKRYILVCTDYATKWVEAKAFLRATEQEVEYFLYEDIFTRLGCLGRYPQIIVHNSHPILFSL